MVKHCFSLLLSLLVLNVYAQKEGNTWVFGNNAGLDFNTGQPISLKTAIVTHEGAASVSDWDGNLLFYTEGYFIWDRNHNLMPNGTNLPGFTNQAFESTTKSTTQACVIVPIPDSADKYYIFSLTAFEEGVMSGRLYYSVMDMRLNGGLGDIVPGRKGIFIDSNNTEKLTAVQGDRCNIWVLVAGKIREFKAYEITGNGINLNAVISPGDIFAPGYNAGVIRFSPDRKRLVAANSPFGGLRLYDFDPATGLLTNGFIVDDLNYYGATFSPDSKKLYAISDGPSSLWQYDLALPDAAAISGSKIKIANTSGLLDVKTAPDKKVYLATGTNKLGVINQPDVAGVGCQYNDNAVALAHQTNIVYGLPNEIARFVRDTAHSDVYEVTVCFKNSEIIAAHNTGNGWDYWWEGGQTGPELSVDTAGSYIVHYHTPPCVYHTDTFKVSFLSPVPQMGVYQGCRQAGKGYIWIASTASDTTTYSFTWSDNTGNIVRTSKGRYGDTLFTPVPGQFTVALKGENGCDTAFSLELKLPAYNTSFLVDTVVCTGDTVSVTNTSSGISDYLWLLGNGDTSLLVNPQLVYTLPGTYNVTLVGNPCNDSAVATVVVDTMSFVSFKISDREICEGNTITFTPVYPMGITGLEWDFGNNTSDVSQPTQAYDSPGKWLVSLTAKFRACPLATTLDTVIIYPHPVVNLGRDTFLCLGSQPLTLQNLLYVNTGNERYKWNNGDTTSFTSVKHPDIYTLTATSGNGCTTVDSIKITKSCFLDIPNAFTPDGDGINDYFSPRQQNGNRLSRFKMKITNRWGQPVFESSSVDGRGWDGKYNDQHLPSGVYIYEILVELDGFKKEEYSGNITLIR